MLVARDDASCVAADPSPEFADLIRRIRGIALNHLKFCEKLRMLEGMAAEDCKKARDDAI